MTYNNILGQVIAPGEVTFLNREIVDPAAGKIVVEIVASAICGSDLHIFKGKHPSAPLPVTIGHEFSGNVVAIGKGVTTIAVGDKVTVEPVMVCGKCEACRTGTYGYCENISFTYRNGDGAMARYITVEEPYVYKLPDNLSYNAGALIEPLAVAAHAVRRAEVTMGENVVIIGAGAIGLLIAALCKKRGVQNIAVVDFSATRLALAQEYGASLLLNPAEQDVETALNEWTSGKGAEKSFECVGLEATFRQAMMCLRKNGLATIIGIFEQPEITIPATRFITHEIKVQGSQGYCWDFPLAIAMSEEIDLEKLVTHEFPLSELKTALETCLDRDAGAIKIILHPLVQNDLAQNNSVPKSTEQQLSFFGQ